MPLTHKRRKAPPGSLKDIKEVRKVSQVVDIIQALELSTDNTKGFLTKDLSAFCADGDS